MLPHLLFWVDANPVVLNMLVHVLTQGHNGRCCCLSSRLAASHVLQYFTSFVQLQFNFYHLLVACRYTCQWHWSTLRPGGTATSAVADFGRALAKMKCPSNYLSGLTKYVLTSSILPIPVAINGYVLYGPCIKHVLVNMPNTFLLLRLPFIDIWAILCSGSTCLVMFNYANCIFIGTGFNVY